MAQSNIFASGVDLQEAAQSDILRHINSTTGSDATGDGSSEKPYATLGKALNSIPKYLNGFSAVVYCDGIFDISGLSHDGSQGGTVTITASVLGSAVFTLHNGGVAEIIDAKMHIFEGVIFEGQDRTGELRVGFSEIDFRGCQFRDLFALRLTESNMINITGGSVDNCEWIVFAEMTSVVGLNEVGGEGNINGFYSAAGSSIGAAASTVSANNMYVRNGGYIINGDDGEMPSGKDILINWYLRNPVNQRNITGAFSAIGQYFIDCWKLTSGTVTLTPNGLTLNGTIVQILEYAAGANVTSSLKMHSGTATASYDNATKTFVITSSGGTIAAAKLETGTVSTLANDPPQDFGVELAKCQRRQFNPFYPAQSGQQGYLFTGKYTGSGVYGVMPLPVSLRAKPTIVIDPSQFRAFGIFTGGFQIGVEVTDISVYALQSNGVILRATIPNGVSGNMYTIYTINQATATPVLLDANMY